MSFIQRPAWYIYDDRLTVIWEAYEGSSFVKYEVYVGTESFTPSPSTLYATITDIAVNHKEVLNLSAKRNYETIIRLITTDSTDSNRRHITTCEANEGVVVQSNSDFYFWQNQLNVLPGRIELNTRTASTDSIDGVTMSPYVVKTVSKGNQPFFSYPEITDAHPDFMVRPPANVLAPTDGSEPFGIACSAAFDENGNLLPFIGNDRTAYGCIANDVNADSWGRIFPIAIQEPGGVHTFHNPTFYNPPIELSDGSFLQVFYGTQNLTGGIGWSSPGNSGIIVARTTDKINYTQHGVIMPFGTPYVPNECATQKISGDYPNERIIAVFRTENSYTTDTYKHRWSESFDSGQTWTPSVQINTPFRAWCPPNLYYDKENDRLLLTIANRALVSLATETWNKTSNWAPPRGHQVFVNETLTPTGFGPGTQINITGNDTDEYGNAGGYCQLFPIVERNEIMFVYPAAVGKTSDDGGPSKPWIAFKIFDKDTLQVKAIPKYSYETDPYKVSITTPLLFLNGSTLTVQSTITGLSQGDSPSFQYSADQQIWTNMPLATLVQGEAWQASKDFSGIYQSYYFRAVVSGVYSEISPLCTLLIPSAYGTEYGSKYDGIIPEGSAIETVLAPYGAAYGTPYGGGDIPLTPAQLLSFYLSQASREFETKAVINSTTYDSTAVVTFEVEDSIIPSEDFVIGSVISSKLTLCLRTADTIPANASIAPYVRLKGYLGTTVWVALGTYYIDTRGNQNGVWTFTCFDKLILSQQPYVSALTYPATMVAVFSELCGQLGVTADSSLVINPAYLIPYRDLEITMRNMLGYIASAHGASIRLTKDTEKIAFVKFSAGATQTTILASDYFKAQQSNPLKTYTAVCLTYNTDGETLTAGYGDDDHTLKVYNPFMDQTMLNNVCAAIQGFSYMPFTMDWKGNPTINVGDSVLVTQRDGTTFPSVILTNKASFKGGLKATITAPSYSAQRSETDYKGGLQHYVNAQVSKALQPDQPYYGVTLGRASGLNIERSDGVSKATFNSDLLEILRHNAPVFKVNEAGWVELTGVIVNGGTITWGAGGVNPPTAGQVGALPVGWTPNLAAYVTGSALASSLTGYLTNSNLTTVLGQDYIITGKIAANQVAVGILDGFTITGATVEAKNYLKVASNIWNGESSNYGIQFGNTMTNYAIPSTMKYFQGLAGDGSTFFEIRTAGDTQFELYAGWFDVFADGLFHYDLTTYGTIYTNKLSPRSGTRIYLGDYGCNFDNTSDGIMRLANGAGAYLYISGSRLSFYRSDGTSVDLVP